MLTVFFPQSPAFIEILLMMPEMTVQKIGYMQWLLPQKFFSLLKYLLTCNNNRIRDWNIVHANQAVIYIAIYSTKHHKHRGICSKCFRYTPIMNMYSVFFAIITIQYSVFCMNIDRICVRTNIEKTQTNHRTTGTLLLN